VRATLIAVLAEIPHLSVAGFDVWHRAWSGGRTTRETRLFGVAETTAAVSGGDAEFTLHAATGEQLTALTLVGVATADLPTTIWRCDARFARRATVWPRRGWPRINATARFTLIATTVCVYRTDAADDCAETGLDACTWTSVGTYTSERATLRRERTSATNTQAARRRSACEVVVIVKTTEARAALVGVLATLVSRDTIGTLEHGTVVRWRAPNGSI
jgi:hypothetical protein